MFRETSEEVEIKTSINEAWEVYSTFKLGKIIESELSHIFKVDILEGDWGVGSIFKVTIVANGSTYKESYTKIDNENKVKEVEIIEGWYLEIGFTSFRLTFEFFEQNEDSCILRVTAEYEANEDVVFDIKVIMNAFGVINLYIEKQNET